MVLYRGSKTPYYFNSNLYDKNNEIYTMDQPTSTSFRIMTAFGFSSTTKNCCMMILSLPAGSKGLVIFTDLIKTLRKGFDILENEVILPINSKIKLQYERNDFKIKISDKLNFNNYTFTFWKGIINIDIILDLIKQFKEDPSKQNFYSLPIYIQKIFILLSKKGLKENQGNQKLMKEILQY